MAFTLQTLPQFTPPNPYDQLTKGFKDSQQAQTNRLNQQKLKKDLDNYDRVLNAELSKMLAATEASQASTLLSQEQLTGTQFQNQLQSQYGEQQLLNEMAYKNAIGSSAMSNAVVADINAQLAAQRLPLEMEQLRRQNENMARESQYLAGLLAKMSGGGAAPLSQNTQVSLPGAEVETSESEELIPDNFLPPVMEELPDLFGKYEEKYQSEEQTEANKAKAGAQAREGVKARTAYSNSAIESATVGAQENEIIEGMKFKFGDIPEWNKGALAGMIEPFSQEAKVYEGLYSGAVLNVLADQKGVANENDRRMIERTYPNRTFNEASMDELATFRQIVNDRKIEKQEFISRHPDQSAESLESGWNKYIGEQSIFETPRYQSYLQRRWGRMSPAARVDDELRFYKMLEENQ